MHFLTIHYTLCVGQKWKNRLCLKLDSDFFFFTIIRRLVWLTYLQVDSRLDKDSSINLAYMFSTCLLFGWFGFLPLLAGAPVICWCLNELLTSQRMCTLNTIYYLGYPKYQLQRVTNTIVPDIVWIFGRGASSINMASVHGKKADR